jgi:hypothetical protein
MIKYAIVKQIVPDKAMRFLNPWLLLNAKVFETCDQVPLDHIIVSYHWPGWLDPLKSWVDKGGKYIEIEYGYWGDINSKGKTLARRITYNNSFNLNMKSVPYSRKKIFFSRIQDWKEVRGEYLLIPMPNQDFLFMRKGITIEQWKTEMLGILESVWDGPIKWREKRGAKGGLRQLTFENDLRECFAVVGERTMACAEAIMLGYPAYTIDDTIITPLMGKDLSVLKNPILHDREQWFEHVAWSQFYDEEFKDGDKVARMVEQYQIC